MGKKLHRPRNVVHNFPEKEAFMEKVYECMNNAEYEFGISFRNPEIVFTKNGATIGKGGIMMGHRPYLQFSVEAIQKGWDEMVNDTLPHEVAHVVDMLIRGRTNHDRHWKAICIRLGGSGKRTHSMEVSKARKTRKYIYVATCGTEIKVGANIHKKLQMGLQTRTIRKTKGQVGKNQFTGKMVWEG